MNSDQIANLAFMGLLAAAIAGSYLMANRGNMGRVAQQAAIWGLIFVGVIAAYGMWSDIQRNVMPQQSVIAGNSVQIPRSPDGHYYVTVDVNGTPLRFVVDTGATLVVLTQQDAARVGIDTANLRYLGTANTANGEVQTANIWLDSMTLGGVTDAGVRASVNGGQMEGSLLGMSYLGLYDRIEIANDTMILTR